MLTYEQACDLCPRCCRVVRARGQTGFCRAGDKAKLYRWAPHFGEEPPLSGRRGSGTIFFSHCTLSCFYCQNYPLSQQDMGTVVPDAELGHIFVEIGEQGCHNWNLVSPTPWLPAIRAAVGYAKELGVTLPLVYNTSGFERLKTVEEYRDLMDIVLTDLRYADPRTALEASAAGDYVERSREFAAWCWREIGPLQLDANGIATRGMICRLLVLPGRAQEAVSNLEWLADNIGNEVYLSLMSQYTPAFRAFSKPGWDRTLTRKEYELVCNRLQELGFEKGWTQKFSGTDSDSLLGYNMPPGGTGPRHK